MTSTKCTPAAVLAMRERQKKRRVTLARNTCSRLEAGFFLEVGSEAWLAYWQAASAVSPTVAASAVPTAPARTGIAPVLALLPGGHP